MTTGGALDHIVVICPDLDHGMAHFEALSGVRPVYGGAHASGLTHNALVGLGGRRYLEILAPVGPPSPADDEWTRLARSTQESRVLTYCLRSPRPLAELASIGRARGWAGDVATNGRTTPEGVRLRWEWLAPRVEYFGYAFPFFIDWLDSVHPSDMLRERPGGSAVRLEEFAVGHPESSHLGELLAELGMPIETFRSDRTQFRVRLDTPSDALSLA
jgi:hypothetical protein